MKINIFLPSASNDLKSKLDRLIEQSLPALPEMQSGCALPIWSANFFEVSGSRFFENLSMTQQEQFLTENSAAILEEAIAIEHAGIAYGHRMALEAKTQEERNYYTTVALEELEHLMWLKPHCQTSQLPTVVPSFAGMIAEMIATDDRESLLLLIQVFLEGWGIHYYTQLVENTEHAAIRAVFANILKDESRHHAGGILLFKEAGLTDHQQLLPKIQSLVDTVRIGPYQVARSLAVFNGASTPNQISEILESIQCQSSTSEKLKIVQRILAKSLPTAALEKLNWSAFKTEEMAAAIVSSLHDLKNQVAPTDISL